MEPSPLVYDTAAAAAVWQRVGPALPAYDAAPCPAGACCPLPRRETDSEAAPSWRRAWRTAACGSCWRRRRIARRNGENGWQTCWKKP